MQNKIINNPFIKNIATIAMGTTLAQGITIVISPALTRLFSPDDFGVQSVFLSISMILTILFTLQYEMAIVLPKSEEKASVLKIACIKISFIFLIAALVVSCLLALFGMISFSGKSASFVVVALSVVNAWLIAIERIANYSAIREKRFRIVSFAVTAGSISASFFYLMSGIIWGTFIFLLIGAIINHFINILFQLHGHKINLRPQQLKGLFKWSTIETNVLKEYADFPKYRMLQNFINSTSQNIPSIILAAFFSPSVAGFYSLGRRIINLPVILVSDAIRKVYYQHSAEMKNNGEPLFWTSLKITILLAIVGILPYGIIILFGGQLFSIVFGAQWKVAGIYAAWLSLWSFAGFINVPAVSLIPVLNLQKHNLVIEICMIVFRTGFLFWGVAVKSPIFAIAAFSLCGVTFNIFLTIWVFWYCYRLEKSEGYILVCPK